LAIGLLAALALVAAPFVPAKENVLTGVALLGFAFGWALLAVLSARSSDQPQRWAVAPAVFMALAGLVSLIGSAVRNVFGWVWPPVLLGLVVWIFIRARRQLRSRIGRWMLYPVLAVLMVASVCGGYQTVRQSIDTRAYPMPGRLVDVGGHRMHLHCTGSGSPTVVLEPGECLLTGQGRPPSSGQEYESVGQPIEDLFGGEDSRPYGGELDGQRQAVEAPAQPDHGRLVRAGQHERPRCGDRTLGEQQNGFVLPELGEWFSAVGRRKPQWRHGDNVFPRHLERLPGRVHDSHTGRSAKDLGHQMGDGIEHVLTVVEDQQQLAVA
jgi:hypothetical protein